jgi:glycosyltransferase involved in cell wall biosynthesis
MAKNAIIKLMNRKKLLFVITKGTWGGAQKYVYDVSIAFKNEFDIAVVHGTPGHLVRKLTEAGIRTIEIPSLGRDINPLLDLASFRQLLKLFRDEKADIVHLNSSKIGGLGALAGRLARIKNIIFTVHGWAFNEHRSFPSRIIIWILSWITAMLSHHVIVLSNRELKQAKQMPFLIQKTRLIPNGIQTLPFLSRTEARIHLKQQSNIPLDTEKMWIGTISELHPNKGLIHALQAIHTFIRKGHQLHFIIIGEGKERKILEKKIHELELQHHVSLLGNVKDAAQYLKSLDIFLLSSVKEGLPYVILEAGQAEIPMVASHIGGIPELTDDGRLAHLVKPKSSEDIVRAITYIIEHRQEATRIAQELKQLIGQRYAVDNMMSQTRKLYQDTV